MYPLIKDTPNVEELISIYSDKTNVVLFVNRLLCTLTYKIEELDIRLNLLIGLRDTDMLLLKKCIIDSVVSTVVQSNYSTNLDTIVTRSLDILNTILEDKCISFEVPKEHMYIIRDLLISFRNKLERSLIEYVGDKHVKITIDNVEMLEYNFIEECYTIVDVTDISLDRNILVQTFSILLYVKGT